MGMMDSFDGNEEFFIGVYLLICANPCPTIDPEHARFVSDLFGLWC
jgi:hypothetical protein